VQLHGDESPADCLLPPLRVLKALRVRDAESLARADEYPVDLLLDAWSDQVYGGSGRQFDWQLARALAARRPIILAGGLRPDNVAEAVAAVNPYAVDVSNGRRAEKITKKWRNLSAGRGTDDLRISR
jgi:phosphoribosylanthranilate isomerase